MRKWLQYECELITLLLLVIISGVSYGILEATYINTDAGNFKTIPWTGGHFAYYHLLLCAQMFVAAFSITFMADWIAVHRKKYTLLMSIAGFLLAILVEDITWFTTRWRPISRTEWTIWPQGWAIPLGFTWIPVWYLGILLFSTILLVIASRLATLGYKKSLTVPLDSGTMEYGRIVSYPHRKMGSRQRKRHDRCS